MKYLLCQAKRFPVVCGSIFEFVRENGNTTTQVKVLHQIKDDNYTYEIGSIINLDREHLKNVTPIYKKISKLYNILNIKKYTPVFSIVTSIKEDFEMGIYPSRNDFINMNRFWEEIK